MTIDINQLREILEAIAQTDITELTLKSDDFELTVRKDALSPVTLPVPAPAANAMVPPPTVPITVPAENSVSMTAVPDAAATSEDKKIDKKWVEVTSPMVGTFYRAPAPDEPPFVEVNDSITTGQTVCIIEAMKLMNEIEAEVSGQVMEVSVQNGEPVEYGQTLMWVNPSA